MGLDARLLNPVWFGFLHGSRRRGLRRRARDELGAVGAASAKDSHRISVCLPGTQLRSKGSSSRSPQRVSRAAVFTPRGACGSRSRDGLWKPQGPVVTVGIVQERDHADRFCRGAGQQGLVNVLCECTAV